MSTNRPLLSCCMLVYNNSKFVKEAIESLLRQTYTPLEIIISDDNSSDDSFEIVEKVVRDYDGPHTIVLNKNEKNLGVCGQVNKIVSIAKGEFLIGFAGDDIAEPDRAEKIYNHIKGTEINYLNTDFYELNQATGQKKLVRNKNVNTNDIFKFLREPNAMGATVAFSKDLYTVFGNLNEDNFIEDYALAFRAFLLGKVSYLHEPTIQYRIHNENLSSTKLDLKNVSILRKRFEKWYPAKEKLYNQYMTDLQTSYQKKLVTNAEYVKIEKVIEKLKKQNEISYHLDLYWLSASAHKGIVKLCISALKAGLPVRFIAWRLVKKLRASYL